MLFDLNRLVTMSTINIRNAMVSDIPFLVETIIEAEKSGTDKLSYSTVFELTQKESEKYIADMLNEDIDGCELSISSFLIAEKEGQVAAAIAAWIEAEEEIPSTVLKGNLLNYVLPKWNIERGTALNPLFRDLHIEYVSGTLQLGLVYVASAFRGQKLVSLLINEKIRQVRNSRPDITEMHVQVFGNNLPAIKAYAKEGFKTVIRKKSFDASVTKYLPSDEKILMVKELIKE